MKNFLVIGLILFATCSWSGRKAKKKVSFVEQTRILLINRDYSVNTMKPLIVSIAQLKPSVHEMPEYGEAIINLFNAAMLNLVKQKQMSSWDAFNLFSLAFTKKGRRATNAVSALQQTLREVMFGGHPELAEQFMSLIELIPPGYLSRFGHSLSLKHFRQFDMFNEFGYLAKKR